MESTSMRDVGELYAVFSKRLRQRVRTDVRAPEPVIDDACQFAWTRLVDHADRVRRESALPWLVTTAVREAFKQIRRARREVSLDAVLEEPAALQVVPMPPLDLVLERRERLDALRELPLRQQRLVWLHAMGLSYVEMAEHEGCSRRTVERQLLRAKQRVRRRAAG